MKAVKVVDELNTFLTEKIKFFCNENVIDYELHFHSNVIPDNESQKLRVYLTRKIIREDQDTLAVDVADFGKRRYTSIGAYAISFFASRNLNGSYRKMENVVQQLKNALRQEQFDCMWVRHITATPLNMENNSYQYGLSFSYEFDEII